MKTKTNYTSWKSTALAVTAAFLMSGVASAQPTPTPAPVTVSLPIDTIDTTVPLGTVLLKAVTCTNIPIGLNYVGFQGDFTFNDTVITFSPPLFVEKAGLTSGNWNVSANILPGPGPIRTLRVSAFSNDFTPLSGSGTLYNLRMLRVGNTGASTPLTWLPDPNNFIFIDANLDSFPPAQNNGMITITGPQASVTPTATASSTVAMSPSPTSTATATATSTPTATATSTPTATATVTPTATSTATAGGTPCGMALTENFDSVVAPALPAGWVASNAQGAPPLWVTSTTTPDSPPNDAFADDPAAVSDKYLDTPGIAITAVPAQVSFRHFYNTEPTFDGGVLEVSSPNIGGGAFTDITNAAVGGSFVTGGYTGAISTAFMSPIAGRMAWNGNSNTYVNTVANLGPNVNGQTIKLRFRMASDNSVSATGWRIDNVSVVVGTCPSPTPTATTPPPTPSPGACAWTAGPVVPAPILDEPIVSVGGNMYSFAGVQNGAIVATSYKFDGTTWTTIAPLPTAVEFPAAVTDGTNIFILGGALTGTGTPQTTLYRYNVAANTYTTLAPFTTGTWNHAAAYLNGKIYKFAGTGPATNSTNVLEIYDVASNTWTLGAVYPQSTSFVGAFVQGNFIYAAGGISAPGSTVTNKSYRYDPATNTWDDAAIADLPDTRWGAACGFYNGNGIMAGGYVAGAATANISNTAISWDLGTNTWTSLPNMAGERSRMGGAALGGSFYVVGGRSIASPTFTGTNDNQKLTCGTGPTPTATSTGTPSATPTATATTTATPTATATATATGSPSCTPFAEGFEDITVLPGWMQINHSTTIGTTGWFQGNTTVFPAQGGTAASYIGANFNNTTNADTISNWLLTPPVTLQNGETMTFYTRTVDVPTFPDRLQVRMSTNGSSSNVGTTATDVGDFTALLLDINPTYTTTGYPNVWTQFTVMVTGVPSATSGRLAFRYFVENGGPNGANSDYIGIDTFVFNGPCGGGPTPTPSGTISPTPTATATASGSCPPVITESSTQTITTGNSVSCNNGVGHTDNSYWRAFNMASFVGGSAYGVTSVSFGVETANVTQPVTVRLYTNSGAPFPGGTRTQIATTTIDVTAAQTGTVVTTPLVATVPAGAELVMELFTPNGEATGALFFMGSNADPQSGLSYLSAVDCGVTTPTDTATLGFPNMHIVFNIQGGCIGSSPTPTATVTATATATATATVPGPTPTATATATATTPVETPTPTPSITPTPTAAAQPVNLSTRLRVETDANVGIGGFIITGTAPKTVLLRGIGPSLAAFGVPDPLADPVMELHGPTGFTTITNDNWKDTQQAAIKATGLPPTNDLESAILATLSPGNYTAILKGKNNTTGVALVEVYDLDQAAASTLANISTRASVGTGSDVVIAGFILGNGPADDNVIVRGIGPSLTAFGVPNALANPTLELRNSNGALLVGNNDWQDDPTQAAIISGAGLAPTNPLESGIAATLSPGEYTAILAGFNSGVGVGLVEVYHLGAGAAVPSPTPSPSPSATASGTPGPTATATATATGAPSATPTATATATAGAGPCVENFDGVSAPTLPAGWVATNPDPGDGVLWVTSTVTPDSAPNDAFIPDQDGISDKVLDRIGVTISGAAAMMTFRNNFDTEFSGGVFWDGFVLEVSAPNISSGDFLDITDSHVGGSFVSGGYTGTIDGTANNPLAGRQAWSGSSGGYIDTVVNLGPNLTGQTVTLRFRMGSDEAVAAPGVFIDTISISGASCP